MIYPFSVITKDGIIDRNNSAGRKTRGGATLCPKSADHSDAWIAGASADCILTQTKGKLEWFASRQLHG
jgi:hypothetical protein